MKRVISQKERELLNEVLPMRRLVPMGYDVILQRKNKEYFLKLVTFFHSLRQNNSSYNNHSWTFIIWSQNISFQRQAKLLNVASEDANYKEPSTTVDLNAQLWNLQKYRPNVSKCFNSSEIRQLSLELYFNRMLDIVPQVEEIQEKSDKLLKCLAIDKD